MSHHGYRFGLSSQTDGQTRLWAQLKTQNKNKYNCNDIIIVIVFVHSLFFFQVVPLHN